MKSQPSSLASLIADAQRTSEERMRTDAAAKGLDLDAYERAVTLEQRRREDEERAQTATESRRHILERHGNRVPSHLHGPFLAGTMSATPALTACREWLASDRPRPILILVGGTGTGKTVAALNALSIIRGQFVDAPLLGRRCDPWRSELEQGIQFLDLERTPLIVLDDLGTERADDDRFVEAFGRLVNLRQGTKDGRALRTLITSNLPPTEIRRRYGDRVADRLNEIGKAVPLQGASMRSQRAS